MSTIYTDVQPLCNAHEAFDDELVAGTTFVELTMIGLPGWLCQQHAEELAVTEIQPVHVVGPEQSIEDNTHTVLAGTEVDLYGGGERRTSARIAQGLPPHAQDLF